MNRVTRRGAVILAVALALVGIACDAGTGTGPSGTTPNCWYTPTAPTVTDLNTKLWIQAVVTAGCDAQRPNTFQMRVAIERELAGGWAPVNPGNGEFADCEEPPSPGHPITCKRLIPCVSNGHYRTNITVTGSFPDRDIAYHEQKPPDSVITCM